MFKHLTRVCLRLPSALETTNLTFYRFAGHSKWQNIRHIKGAKDAERSLLFTKLSRQMKVAIQEGGSIDIKKNLKLENVIEQAKRANMPTATIQSVLRSCEQDKSNSKSHLIEIKGPGGCIILCEVFTSNLHALKQNISTILKKHKGKYSDGGGMHLFEEKGVIVAEMSELEEATDHAIEVGAEDVKDTGGYLEFTCGASSLNKVVSGLEKFNYRIKSASVEFIPLKVQELSDEDLKICASLYEKLEGLSEVVRLSDNIA
ncbi:translational activator of cytochrome c oxidase 1 [Tribolium madens]|uniref:translational activator of cytochrome c oxidase 1 n=1 Tax=Tribolium madens TaxID=41895 RepID=UPI001CF74850|nr:translational activator of cytochrome c oxidase 1 [Tribolium madens]